MNRKIVLATIVALGIAGSVAPAFANGGGGGGGAGGGGGGGSYGAG